MQTSKRPQTIEEGCPSCGSKGRSVKPVTIETLVLDEARRRIERTDGFRFCGQTACDIAYFHPETGDRLLRSDVKVRIGQKETTPPRPVCYCFDHTVEEIDSEVKETGTSRIPDEITEKCREGLDRCEETNPQGACCLGNVRDALRQAQAQLGAATPTGFPTAAPTPRESEGIEEDCCAMNSRIEPCVASRLDAGAVAQIGALMSAIVASACCWLPLLLIALGISGGALSATFEAWRPVFLPVTFLLLGMAFYFTYRIPKGMTASGSDTGAAGDACCSVPDQGVAQECCPPANAKGITLKKVNKVMLWIVTGLVLAFAFFPNYVGYLLAGEDELAARNDLSKVVLAIEGMTCEACAASIEDALRKVPGIAAAEVNYERREAVVGVPIDSQPPREEILSAIARAGNYRARFEKQVQWTLAIEGMTCEGCASALRVALSEVPGVTSVSVSYEQGEASVAAASSVSEDVLGQAVSDMGYTLKSTIKK